jgi:hypothetical protein
LRNSAGAALQVSSLNMKRLEIYNPHVSAAAIGGGAALGMWLDNQPLVWIAIAAISGAAFQYLCFGAVALFRRLKPNR